MNVAARVPDECIAINGAIKNIVIRRGEVIGIFGRGVRATITTRYRQ